MATETFFDLDAQELHDPEPTRLVADRYGIVGMLGAGGTGTVYRAHDDYLDVFVALKRLKPALANHPGMLARLRREVVLSRRIVHPHVVRTHDLGLDDQGWFLTMECLEGGSLTAQLARGTPEVGQALSMMQELCEGTAAIHATGWVHCDLKPDNVLLDSSGRVVITDFGIACAPGPATQVAGTPGYAAPEQLTGATIDNRTDVFGLAAVATEMFTGRPPFSRRVRVPEGPPALDGLPGPIQEVLAAALSLDPERRPSSARELAAMLLAASSRSPMFTVHRARRLAPLPGAIQVAVLPFSAVGVEDELAGGVRAELVSLLGSAHNLNVRPIRAGRSSQDDVLRADVSVEGSVQEGSDGLLLVLRAVSAADGVVVWRERRVVPTAELLSTLSRLAEGLAGALAARTAPAGDFEVGDARAADLYLRGRHRLLTSWERDPGEAVPLLVEAAERRPDDPRLLAILALARARQAFWASAGHDDLLAAARKAAARAVDAGPELGESWASLAMVNRYEKDAPAGVRSLVRALAGAPGLAWAHEMLGAMLSEAGRPEAARVYLDAATTLDPEAGLAPMELQRLAAYEADWARAARIAEEASTGAMRLYGPLLEARYRMWREGAFRDPTLAARMPDDKALAPAFPAFATGALPAGALAQLTDSLSQSSDRLRSLRTQFAAEILAVYGDPAGALNLVEQAVRAGLQDRMWIRRCPTLATLRGDAGFEALALQVDARADAVLTAYDATLAES